MLIGRVNWFGGLNKKTNKINNFGFIIPCEVESPDEIFVRRNDVPKHLQSLLEGEKGEGVYVQFEIEIDSRGKQQAVNVELTTLVGTVDWFDKERGYINCESRSDVRFTSSDSCKSGDILYFGIRYNSEYKKDEAILVQKVEHSCKDWSIIEKCVQSCNPEIFGKFLVHYIQNISKEEAKSLVLEKIELLDFRKKLLLINELISTTPELLLVSPELRSILNEYDSNNYGHFIDKHLDSIDGCLKQELLDELIKKVRESSDYQRSVYWNQVKYLQEHLEYRGLLWEIAPIARQKQLIQNKYQNFFDTVSQFNNSNYPYAQAISVDYQELYKFNEIDKKLIQKWDSTILTYDYNAAKMISARGAEKLVIKFYEALGDTVEDISVHQVTLKSQNWIKGDVALNSKDLLDVKNARSSVNSEVYSEFCVPAFKQNRGDDVKIIAVLSPYLQKQYMGGTLTPQFSVKNPKILGVFDKTKLGKLEQFLSDRLISINMSRGLDTKNYLPHWLFDYDDRFYAKQLEAVAIFQQLADADIPKWEDILILSPNQNFLPIFIASKRKLPTDWLNSLPQWQAEFIDSLINLPIERISLPYVFLSILRHFLTMLSDNSSDYNPQEYRNILYTNSESSYPLKLYDPLNTIKDFCDSLKDIWEHRKKRNLTEFKIFKFNGRGLLQAKRSEADKISTTILAYCGGRIEKKGKCGHAPLVIGKHENCPTCGRLICPQKNCRHCCDGCLSYLERKENQVDYDF